MVSAELLSEVTGDEISTLRGETQLIENKIYYSTEYDIPKVINIHELAYKCKKWAYGLGYDIKESKNSLVISKFTSTGHERVLIERYKLHGVKPEEIIEGCQYILEQKAKS